MSEHTFIKLSDEEKDRINAWLATEPFSMVVRLPEGMQIVDLSEVLDASSEANADS